MCHLDYIRQLAQSWDSATEVREIQSWVVLTGRSELLNRDRRAILGGDGPRLLCSRLARTSGDGRCCAVKILITHLAVQDSGDIPDCYDGESTAELHNSERPAKQLEARYNCHLTDRDSRILSNTRDISTGPGTK